MHLFHVFLHTPSKKKQVQAFSARFCLRQLYQKPQHPEILQLQHYADGEFFEGSISRTSPEKGSATRTRFFVERATPKGWKSPLPI